MSGESEPSIKREGKYSRNVHPELQVTNSVFGQCEGWQRASQLFFWEGKVSCPANYVPVS